MCINHGVSYIRPDFDLTPLNIDMDTLLTELGQFKALIYCNRGLDLNSSQKAALNATRGKFGEQIAYHLFKIFIPDISYIGNLNNACDLYSKTFRLRIEVKVHNDNFTKDTYDFMDKYERMQALKLRMQDEPHLYEEYLAIYATFDTEDAKNQYSKIKFKYDECMKEYTSHWNQICKSITNYKESTRAVILFNISESDVIKYTSEEYKGVLVHGLPLRSLTLNRLHECLQSVLGYIRRIEAKRTYIYNVKKELTDKANTLMSTADIILSAIDPKSADESTTSATPPRNLPHRRRDATVTSTCTTSTTYFSQHADVTQLIPNFIDALLDFKKLTFHSTSLDIQPESTVNPSRKLIQKAKERAYDVLTSIPSITDDEYEAVRALDYNPLAVMRIRTDRLYNRTDSKNGAKYVSGVNVRIMEFANFLSTLHAELHKLNPVVAMQFCGACPIPTSTPSRKTQKQKGLPKLNKSPSLPDTVADISATPYVPPVMQAHKLPSLAGSASTAAMPPLVQPPTDPLPHPRHCRTSNRPSTTFMPTATITLGTNVQPSKIVNVPVDA